MIHYSEIKYREDLMSMWKLCFHDSDKFIQFYFKEVYRDEEVLIFIENNQPAAALQIIPYTIKIKGQTFNAGYISGAMTHPSHRRKGLMEQLLHFSFDEMSKNQMQLSFLIPQEKWLFDFYAKYDYQKAFPLEVEEIRLQQIPGDQLSTVQAFNQMESLDVDRLYDSYSRFLTTNENVVLKTRRQFEIILKELFLSRGNVFVSDSYQGMAFALSWKNEIFIKELLFENKQIRQNILSAIQSKYNLPKAKLSIRNITNNPQLFGMVKVIDRKIPHDFSIENIYMSMMLD